MWGIRRATGRDRVGLVALCTAAVGPDDYVPQFLDRFLANGVVLLSEERGHVIGMVVYDDVPDGSAWLHAARTHPDVRRRGVATALMSACETLSRRRHRTAMRLWASADNVASVNANRKYGFRERARFTRMRVDAAVSRAVGGLEPLRLDARVWASVRHSPFFEMSAWYLYHDFYFLRINHTNLARLARDGALWRIGAEGFALSEGFSEEGEDLQVQALVGDLHAFLRAVPSVAAARRARRAETFLPHRAEVLEAARDAGFRPMEWGQEAILFEKAVRR